MLKSSLVQRTFNVFSFQAFRFTSQNQKVSELIKQQSNSYSNIPSKILELTDKKLYK